MKGSGARNAALLLGALLLTGAGVWFGRHTAGGPQNPPLGAGAPGAEVRSENIQTPEGSAETTAGTVAAGTAPVEVLLGPTALKDYFKGLTDANSEAYVIKPGDNLTRIARQYGVTPGMIMAANEMAGDRIFPGRTLRIPKAKFSIVVDKGNNVLSLKADAQVVRSYRIATGKDRSTPEGTFKIINHLKNPTWYYEGKVVPPDSPDNPLGTRWMGFDKEGYGLHGTSKPEEIGQFATLGCVRMLNEDIEALFELLPDGTDVTIIA